ncbi:MAG TPA: hypothetical protein VGQ09_23070 [Chitinophagaceae bacterium]|nr:hypothetical protein [Chitinophagaceae bacterium]
MVKCFYEPIRNEIHCLLIPIDEPKDYFAGKTTVTVINYPLIFMLLVYTTVYDAVQIFQRSIVLYDRYDNKAKLWLIFL